MSPSHLAEARAEREKWVDMNWAYLREMYAQAYANTFQVDDRMLLRHTLIVGASGSGKTNHAFQLILGAVRRNPACSCVVIDVKREYRKLAGVKPLVLSIGGEPKLKFNPLIPPPGVDSQHHDGAFAAIFTRAYGLSEPSRRILLNSLSELRRDSGESPTLRELQRRVADYESGSANEQGSQTSLGARLDLINNGPVGESLNCDEPFDMSSLESRVVVFEIGEVDSLTDQRFLAELLLVRLWLHDRNAVGEDPERLRSLVVVEEAHRYLSEERPPDERGDRTLLELAIAEARRYGWGFVVIDQMPTLLSRYVCLLRCCRLIRLYRITPLGLMLT